MIIDEPVDSNGQPYDSEGLLIEISQCMTMPDGSQGTCVNEHLLIVLVTVAAVGDEAVAGPVADPCSALSFTQTEAYADINYKAGDPPLVLQE